MKEEILVVGARGRIGREVVCALSARGVGVRALVRSLSPVASPLPGVRELVGDLRDRSSLAVALEGVQSAFFVTPHAKDEEAMGLAFIEAARAAKLRRLVFASAYHRDFESALGFSLFVGAMALLTHYGPKLYVEKAVRRSGMSPVVLMPTNFFQNDEHFFREISGGCYPQPLGLRGVNRVDCRDIGEAAARALVGTEVEAGAYPLVGAEATLTGPDCAALWASALGREVVYDGDLARWRGLVKDCMHPREAEDFGKTYKIFARVRVPATAADQARVTHLLGRPPRSYAAYVTERALTLGPREPASLLRG